MIILEPKNLTNFFWEISTHSTTVNYVLFKWICTRSPVGTQRSWFIFLKTVKIDTKDDWSMIIKSFFKIECNWIWSAFLQRRKRGVMKDFSQASPKKQKNVIWIEPFSWVRVRVEIFWVALSKKRFKSRRALTFQF